MGAALLALGHTKDAIERLKQSLNVNPNNEVAMDVMINSYYNLSRYEEAWNLVAKARERNIKIPEKTLAKLKDAMQEPNS